MKKRTAWLGLVMLLMFAAMVPAWASDAVKISGTVTKMGGDTVTVTVETASADVTLMPTTKFTVAGRPAKRDALMVGDAVVASVTKVGPQWQASLVRITHPKKKP